MPLVVNLNSFKTKLLFTFVIFIVFFVLNKTVPPYEFGKDKNISNFDLFYHTLLTHIGAVDSTHLRPVSSRAKLITAVHFILYFTVMLM